MPVLANAFSVQGLVFANAVNASCPFWRMLASRFTVSAHAVNASLPVHTEAFTVNRLPVHAELPF